MHSNFLNNVQRLDQRQVLILPRASDTLSPGTRRCHLVLRAVEWVISHSTLWPKLDLFVFCFRVRFHFIPKAPEHFFVSEKFQDIQANTKRRRANKHHQIFCLICGGSHLLKCSFKDVSEGRQGQCGQKLLYRIFTFLPFRHRIQLTTSCIITLGSQKLAHRTHLSGGQIEGKLPFDLLFPPNMKMTARAALISQKRGYNWGCNRTRQAGNPSIFYGSVAPPCLKN